MPVERRGRAIRVVINLVNWQQEEPNGYGGGRQLSMNGTSRVSGETQARFREGLGVKFPGPTRRGGHSSHCRFLSYSTGSVTDAARKRTRQRAGVFPESVKPPLEGVTL